MPAEISATSPAGHLHEPFLERAVRDGNGDERYALAGFLTLRLVDQFAAHRLPLHPDALAYQCSATGDFLAELGAGVTEVNHLLEIVRVADAVRPSPGTERMLFPPLLAFAYWLEKESRLTEALDVLDTAMRLSADGVGEEEVRCQLQRARALRVSGHFVEAMETYSAAEELAAATDDRHSELLSRIGRGIVLMHLGNLPESERMLKGVLQEARARGDQDAEARASHDLGVTYTHMGRTALAVPLLFDAYSLYAERFSQLRALGDLGIALKDLGQLQAAENAFFLVAEGEATKDVRLNATLELIETSVLRGDRVAFERWKRAARPQVDGAPSFAIDFFEKLGRGCVQFGNTSQAIKHLERALELAEQYRFNECVFRIEKLLEKIRAGSLEEPSVPQPEVDDAAADAVSAVASRLEQDRLRHESESAIAGSAAGTGL